MTPIDNPIEDGHIEFPDTTVLSTAVAAVVWTDIDCSAVVGTRRCLLFLKVKQTTADDLNNVVFRQNGTVEEVSATASMDHGCSGVFLDVNTEFGHCIVSTAGSGTIEYKADNNQDIEVVIVAFIYED